MNEELLLVATISMDLHSFVEDFRLVSVSNILSKASKKLIGADAFYHLT